MSKSKTQKDDQVHIRLEPPLLAALDALVRDSGDPEMNRSRLLREMIRERANERKPVTSR